MITLKDIIGRQAGGQAELQGGQVGGQAEIWTRGSNHG